MADDNAVGREIKIEEKISIMYTASGKKNGRNQRIL